MIRQLVILVFSVHVQLMTTVPLIPLIVLVGIISLGYIIFGIYLIYRYDGIGVQSLSLFSILALTELSETA